MNMKITIYFKNDDGIVEFSNVNEACHDAQFYVIKMRRETYLYAIDTIDSIVIEKQERE